MTWASINCLASATINDRFTSTNCGRPRFHRFFRIIARQIWYKYLTAYENIRLALAMGRHKEYHRKRIVDLATRLGLADRLSHRPPQMSVGEQQRVAAARAIAAEPDLILADEPTESARLTVTSQDPQLRARLQIDESARRVANFLNVRNQELKTFARLTGNDDVHRLAIRDICTTSFEISNHTNIEHA